MAWRIAAWAGAFLILASCASAPAGPDQESADGPIPAGKGRLYLYRTTFSIGGANSVFGDNSAPSVRLDDGRFGTVTPGAVMYCDVAAGLHRVAIEERRNADVPVDVRAGHSTYLRVDLGFSVLTQQSPLIEVDGGTGRLDTNGRPRMPANCPA